MKVNKKLIKELVSCLEENKLSELEYSEKDIKIKVARNLVKGNDEIQVIQNTNEIKEKENISGTEIKSPIIGTAHKPSIPPLNIITTRFFFLSVFAKTGKLKPAKNNVVAEPFKKFLLDIFMT